MFYDVKLFLEYTYCIMTKLTKTIVSVLRFDKCQFGIEWRNASLKEQLLFDTNLSCWLQRKKLPGCLLFRISECFEAKEGLVSSLPRSKYEKLNFCQILALIYYSGFSLCCLKFSNILTIFRHFSKKCLKSRNTLGKEEIPPQSHSWPLLTNLAVHRWLFLTNYVHLCNHIWLVKKMCFSRYNQSIIWLSLPDISTEFFSDSTSQVMSTLRVSWQTQSGLTNM